METPTTPNRKHLHPNVQSTPASGGSASSMAGLLEFHVDKVHNLVWLDVLTFQLGSFKRFLHRQLSSVGAIETIKDSGGRGTEDQIDKGLRECLAPMVKAMNASSNSKTMDIIRNELQIYCTQENEKSRYSHFVKATNTALLLLADIQIGNSRPCPSKTSDDFLLFMVHDPKLMKSVHKGVTYDRKPDIVATFQCHIRELYKKGDLLKAVTTAPGKDERPLQWKRALLCVEKKVGKKKIEKIFPKAYSLYSLPDGDYEQRTSIEGELAKRNEVTQGNSGSSQSQSGVGSHSKSGGKRSAEQQPVGPTQPQKKAKNHSDKDRPSLRFKAPSAAAQVADYAAEALYNCYGRSHVVNLLVTDSVINVWYFDHECPIQMTGFDFIDNLPYFLLFLFALQRFSLADWGYIPNTVDINDGKEIDISQSWNTPSPSPKPNVRFCPEQGIDLHPRFGLNGRATGIAGGTVTVQGVTLNQGAVIKLSYPEKSRVREHLFIQEAEKKLNEKQYRDVCDYIPTVLGFQEYHGFDSVLIRKAVLVDLEELRDKAARIPYTIILPKYEPIHSLTTNWTEFLNAFFALVYCHAMLWSIGIEHGDISEGNLMWDPVMKKPKICDFDLSHFEGQKRPSGFANTGTWAFMALELLTIEAMLGKVKRLYRHDLESFFAVLIWVICRYRDGKLLSDPPLKEWNQPRYPDCLQQRRYTFSELRAMETPSGLPEDLWKACANATLLYQNQQSRATLAQDDVKLGITENTLIDEFYQSINIIGPVLAYPLFKMQDGPKFAAKLRSRLPDLPSSLPMIA